MIHRPDKVVLETTHADHKILAYLADHPDAQDTIEGIAEWWLMEQEIKSQVVVVRAAIKRLLDAHFLIELRTSASRVSYRLNPSRKEEVMRIVRGEKKARCCKRVAAS